MTSLSQKLAERERSGKPVQIGMIGAGKFASMFIAQCHRTPGLRLAGVADLSASRAHMAFKRTGFPSDHYDFTGHLSIEDGMRMSKTIITEDATSLIKAPGIDIILEVTGSPAAGVRHALMCFEHKKHIVMINVEADVLAGPLLARRAREAGVIYSMAYGDQPALIAELVDWARVAGFEVVCAGKGTKHLPEYHGSTPATVWDHYGFSKEQLGHGDFKELNPRMFNSFIDGTKSALEMAAVANACGLSPPEDGLKFPPCGRHDIPQLLKPKSEGGLLGKKGTVEVVSCLELDGREVHNDLRWGVYIVVEAPSNYQKECFRQYGLETDKSGRYAVNYKPSHWIGMELGVSVASIMCRGEATGSTDPDGWVADVVTIAKRDLKSGDTLDGEGGFMVWGKLIPAEKSLELDALPIGLAHGLKLKVDIKKGTGISWKDVDWSSKPAQAIAVRREMEEIFSKEFAQRKAAEAEGQ